MIQQEEKSFRARHNCDNPGLSSKQDIGLVNFGVQSVTDLMKG